MAAQTVSPVELAPSTTTLIPEIDISVFLDFEDKIDTLKPALRGPTGAYDYSGTYPANVVSTCEKLATCLKENGILIVRDPRVSEQDNSRFLNMMEDYFEQDEEIIRRDARPQWFYQVGVTPAGVERPRCATDPECMKYIENQEPRNRAQPPTGRDPKWRYMWRIGERPTETKFAELNEPQVVPEKMCDWGNTMDTWGQKMLECVCTVSKMTAIGFGLSSPFILSSKLKNGPHLLAPTATDIGKHHTENEVYAGYHYDMNFLTIHGKSRYPGLYVWSSSGERMPVSIPNGCLLLQAGKELEWLTGGYVTAGMHEVICSKGTIKAYETALDSKASSNDNERHKSLWRISSTLFSHIASDIVLEPLERFHTNDTVCQKYPATLAGDYVSAELAHIKLSE